MRLCARIIATIAVTVSLVPTLVIHAEAKASPSARALDRSAGSGQAEDAAASSSTPGRHARHKKHDTPTIELFLGYSHFRGAPTLSAGNRMVGLNGGSASIAFNFNRYLGLVGDFGGYDNTELRLSGPGANPPRVADADGTVYTFLGGPRISYRSPSRFTPFAQALFGGVNASEVTLSGCTGALCTPLPKQIAFAMTAGLGLDIRLTHHISIRAVQAEYMMTRFPDPTTGSSNSQNDVRLSSGLLFLFGGGGAPIPQANGTPVAVCSVDAKTIYAGSGDSIAVHSKASDPDNDPLTYSWTSSGGLVEGTGPDVRWNSSGTTPGTFTVSLRVDDGRGGSANCSTDIRVEPQADQPPTISCSADRNSVTAGEPVQVTATASDPDNDPLTFSWNASGGQIVDSGATVKFDTTGLATGQYTVTGHVNDGRGGSADCSVNVDAQRAATPLEVRLALHSIYFPTAQPTSQHPEGGLVPSQKQTLVSLAGDFNTYLQSKPDARLILEGHADPRGAVEYNQKLSERRVDRTRHFLIEHGVPEANIETKAFGVQQNLTDAQVKDAVEKNPELTPAERQKALDNLNTIILASNRRVDVTLSNTGQRSVRQYPFNAADSLTLLKKEGSEKTTRPATKRKAQQP